MIAQSLIGIPITSILIKKDAKRLIATGEIEQYRNLGAPGSEIEKKSKLRFIPSVPEKYNKSSLLLTKAALVAIAGIALSNLTGGKLNFLICCLIAGIIATQVGFLDENVLQKAGADGLIMLIVLVYTFEGVSTISPQLFVSLLKPFLIIMIIGVAAILIGGFICSKIFKVSFQMASSIGMTALFGFPATYYIAIEVSEACGSNAEEKKALENYLVPRMLVAGFATVSIGSILAASIMLPGLTSML